MTITGTDFNAASAVKFGTMPATGFTVESDTQITAIAPRITKVGAVDVTVTTLAGTSPAVRADRFFYEGCVVPKLKGKTLKAAKRRSAAPTASSARSAKGRARRARSSSRTRSRAR